MSDNFSKKKCTLMIDVEDASTLILACRIFFFAVVLYTHTHLASVYVFTWLTCWCVLDYPTAWCCYHYYENQSIVKTIRKKNARDL